MAKFEQAFGKTLAHEGGYSNVREDRGGETFMGITRRDHPDWPGWSFVESIRAPGTPDTAGLIRRAKELAADLYRRRYWDRFDGDSIPDQAIAEELFDTAVNMGVGRSVGFLQEALNALLMPELPRLAEDGDMGPKTLAALRTYLVARGPDTLLKALNVLQGARYLEIIANDPTQAKFAHGWFRRVEIRKS